MINLIKYTPFFWAILLALQPGNVEAQDGRGAFGTAYHNITAHYNAYFYANERIKEVEKQLYENYRWNYNKVLPVFPQFDTTFSAGVKELTEDCIQKASIAIQRHKGSKWEDDSYVLVGKARFYASEFPDAIETYKYVNKKGEDDDARHQALIQLIRTFVEFDEINNAIAVSDFLKKEKLNNRNSFDLYLNRAYLYQVRDDEDQLVRNLVKAEELMPRSHDKARVEFIIGQVYQELGFEAEAYKYYENCLRSNPTYELSFYTKLNMAQVTQLASGSDVKRVRKYFKKLLNDQKNIEYKDKIYYEMANFELKHGNLSLAIDYYKKSVKASVSNDRQKAYSYLQLGIIHYDSLKNFPLAKSYYDSTVSVLPKDEENYNQIVQRQEVLADFVEQISIISKNDSLIAMSSISEDSARTLASSIAKKEIEDEKERRKREKEQARNRARATTSFDREGGDLISANLTGDIWYFYNPTAMSRGASAFARTWGNRPLEDNWRRSIKSGGVVAVNQQQEATPTEEESEEALEAQLQNRIDELLSDIPRSEEDIQKLLAEVEVALYKLGNIYNFKLEEKDNAITTFEQLLSRFKDTEYRPEVLYQLYLLYGQAEKEELASLRAKQLKTDHPETVYAKLVDNPNYREDSKIATEQLRKVYNVAYGLYVNGMFQQTHDLIDSALLIHPDNNFSDNLKLLDVKTMGKMDGLYKYQFELNNFIKNYPTSDLLEYAQTLLKASEDYQINIVNSSKAKFIEYYDQKHYLVVAYPNKAELSQSISTDVDEFLEEIESNYSSGTLILNSEFALVLINDIPTKSLAQKILNQLEQKDLSSKYKGEKIHTFIITQDNFDIFYQTKDLNAYLNFYDRKYQ
ncbi:tetratricopeptide repeat protein [Marinoscillum sp. MHG1-6]|uniref:type IX secretion system periplasmic lipoprotein PorW/SprE n=1 Tax=Marinoscillum sp. MHG1-6 TaxID=2959627 RepID=UPI0021574F3C|nr:tetratricopeptide repeat protein [Marinoscillum sp. MHG1-6]